MKNSSKILWSSLVAILVAFMVIVVSYRVSDGSDDVQNVASWLMSDSSAKVEQGNGEIVTKTFQLAKFEAANVGGWFKVIVKPGTTSQATITLDSNLLEHLERNVDGNVLTIKPPRNLRFKPSAMGEIVITSPQLKIVSLGGRTDFYADNLAQDIFELNLAGRSNADIAGKVQTLSLNLAGKADVKSKAMQSKAINIRTAGRSSVKLAGNVEVLSVKTAGKADIHTKSLQANHVMIDSMGRSDITVTATKSLQVNAVGKGQVRYYGNPKVKNDSIGGIELIQSE